MGSRLSSRRSVAPGKARSRRHAAAPDALAGRTIHRMGIDERDGGRNSAQRAEQAGHPPGFVPPRRLPADTFSMVVLWLVIGAVVYLLVQRFVPGLQPVRIRAEQANAVLLTPGPSGGYTLAGAINGVPITFMVDTGASTVSVSAADAARMGLSGCEGISSQTANGSATGCLALARELQFGPFTARDVRVAVLPAMMPNTALLGMNVLSRLQIVQRGGRMMLRLDDGARAGVSGG